MNIMPKTSHFFFPELQSLSGPELSETCQLLDNFLVNLKLPVNPNFPLLSTIRIGQGTYCVVMMHTSIKHCVKTVALTLLLATNS